MMLKEKFDEAFEKKNTDIKSFTWKGEKVLDENGKYKQEEEKLIDMGEVTLNECYDRCKTMLFNKDTQNPGRYLVLEIINSQGNRCGVELFLRFVEQNYSMTRLTLLTSINNFMTVNKEIFKTRKATLEDMFEKIPEEYKNIHLDLVIDGCLDRLGAFNKKHITRAFILRQGIWLTPTESKELLGEGKNIDRLALIREHLGIKEVEKLYINSKGINYTQMRSMLNLKANKKYSDLTTIQLETLRNRILFELSEVVKQHIEFWERKMTEIEMVASGKEIKLD